MNSWTSQKMSQKWCLKRARRNRRKSIHTRRRIWWNQRHFERKI